MVASCFYCAVIKKILNRSHSRTLMGAFFSTFFQLVQRRRSGKMSKIQKKSELELFKKDMEEARKMVY